MGATNYIPIQVQVQTSETPPIQANACNSGADIASDKVKDDLEEVLAAEDVQPAKEKQILQEDPYQVEKRKTFEELLNDSYMNMDKEFQRYLKNFNDNSSKNEELKLELKKYFFTIVMIILALIICLPYFVLIMFRSKVTDATVITICISSLAEVISAIIVLPKIIAKYLFNKNEEKNKIQIISGMQQYNGNKRNQ